MGSKYLKPGLKRALRRHPKKFERACDKLLEDAAGETEIEHVFNHKGEVVTHVNKIGPADRQRALAMFGDRLDGKPLQEIAVDPGSIANVIIARAKLGEDPEMPESVKVILRAKEVDGGLGEEESEDDQAG